jgi:tetratricopeptide (TPR) repeat protein
MERSISVFERYLAAARERADFFDTVRFSVLLANALMDNGSLARAAELLADTLTKVSDTADPFVVARVYWTQSRLHEHQGDHETAARHARRALELLEATDHAEYVGRAHQLLGSIELERGNADEALALAQRSRELMTSASELDLVETTTIEARALARLGEREQAAALAMQAAGLLSQLHPAKAGRNYALLAGIFEELGERERALELYELAVDLLEPHWSSFFADVCARYAEILESEGRKDEALDVLKKGLRSRVARVEGA